MNESKAQIGCHGVVCSFCKRISTLTCETKAEAENCPKMQWKPLKWPFKSKKARLTEYKGKNE